VAIVFPILQKQTNKKTKQNKNKTKNKAKNKQIQKQNKTYFTFNINRFVLSDLLFFKITNPKESNYY
jgi:hypothetical protein